MILPASTPKFYSAQTFCSSKFRLPVGSIDYTINGITLWSRKSYAVKEYSNPDAERLYRLAQQTRDLKEKARLYSEMGHYKLVDMNLRERIRTFLNLPLP